MVTAGKVALVTGGSGGLGSVHCLSLAAAGYKVAVAAHSQLEKAQEIADKIDLSKTHLLYGHTGFTGTCVWVDPKEELIYIFLSNRICPISWNMKLQNMNVRTRIEDVIYQSIIP